MVNDRNGNNEAHPVASHKDAHKQLIIASITIGLIIVMFVLLFSSGNFAGKATGTNIDCGTNWTCFMEYASQCIPVKLLNTTVTTLSGMNITTTTEMEIQEVLAEQCLYKQTKTVMNSSYELICQYPLEKLNELLIDWQNGTFSSEDFSSDYCAGDSIEGFSLAIIPGQTNTSCQDSDLKNVTSKGTITGLELDLTSGSAESKLTSKQDSCYDSSKVIEYFCSADNLIDWELKTCPEKTICLEGACVIAPPLLNAGDVSKTTTKLLAIEKIDKPFWVVTTLLDESGTIILFSKMLYQSLEKDQPYNHTVNYPNLDLVKTKKVVVFDVNDPNVWTVHLNQTFVMDYGGLS